MGLQLINIIYANNQIGYNSANALSKCRFIMTKLMLTYKFACPNLSCDAG